MRSYYLDDDDNDDDDDNSSRVATLPRVHGLNTGGHTVILGCFVTFVWIYSIGVNMPPLLIVTLSRLLDGR